MFHSIRTKLAASYALIILLCLVLAGLGAVVLINRYQRDAALAKYRSAATAITQQVQTLLTLRVGLPQIESRVQREADRLGVRALLVGPAGLVLADTTEEGSLAGDTLRIPPPNLASPQVRRYLDPTGQSFFLVIVGLRAPATARPAGDSGPTHVIISVPEAELQPAWLELAPPLFTAGLVSLVLSAVVAVMLARSITNPLIAMTDASASIALGDYEQAIPATGHDEVARLARSFNRMAREVQRSRQAQQDFVANVSHDLKTPLTSIQGFSQAMLEEAIHDEKGYRRAAQIIHDEAERMSQLVQRVLQLARLDAGEKMTQSSPVAVGELVQQAVQKLAPLVEEAGLELSTLVPHDLPMLVGDREHLKQAVSNLVDNAIKYTPEGGRIEITAQNIAVRNGKAQGPVQTACPLPHARDGRWVAVHIKDTGRGISPEDLPHLFERFYRADKSRTGAGGSGLGLAIAREIVEAHGGTIGVTSDLGRGSCFCVLLPAKQSSS